MKKIWICMVVCAFLVTLMTGCNVSNVLGSAYHYENASSYTMGSAELAESIDEIEISWVSGSVTVQYHDGDAVLISETSDAELTEDTSLYYRVHDKKLTIQYAKSGIFSTFDFGKDLTLSLPKKLTEEGGAEIPYRLSLNTVSADVKILDVAVSECDLENVSGNITASFRGDMTVLQIETVSGNANIAVDAVSEIDAESVSGSISVMGGRIKGGDFETVSGDVLIMLPPNSDYALDFESVSGNAEVLGFSCEIQEDRYIVGSGASRYDVETVSGNVRVSAYKQ